MCGKKKTKIVHALRSLEFGGAEKLVLKLSALQKESGKLSPELACVKGEGELKEEAEEYGLSWRVAGLGGIKYISPIIRLVLLLRRLRPDIVHTHNLVAHVHAAPAARLLGIPVVHTKHGRAVSSFSSVPWLRRWVYNLAGRIAVVSDDTGENFIRRTGIDPGRVVTVYNGIDTESFQSSGPRYLREELGFKPSDIIFGSLSRLSPEKDHRTVIEAFSRVAEGHENCMLIIVGDGPLRQGLERMVSELSLAGKVIFAGFREDTAGCLRAMDLFLQPSLEEGLSLTILEAAAAGVPIITTPVGGTPEILTDGVEGVMVEPGSCDQLAAAMESFLQDRGRFSLMARAARK
ncbi:MAG: glycosyltransferase, partial [Candidatus Latescibacteria bacterium]|nr:glycosyltransferase [Candidatus Latescibacterota bacterium]